MNGTMKIRLRTCDMFLCRNELDHPKIFLIAFTRITNKNCPYLKHIIWNYEQN